MSGYLVIDAAVPPPIAPLGTHAVLGYIGGNATHVWTVEQWLAFEELGQLPAWVADMSASPGGQGAAAAAAAVKLGWAPRMPGGAERAIVIDMETNADAAFYGEIAGAVLEGGFVPVCYGSLSTVLLNAAEDVLAAAWDHIPQIPAGQTFHGLQYAANVPYQGTQIDQDVIDRWLFDRCGVGPRKNR